MRRRRFVVPVATVLLSTGAVWGILTWPEPRLDPDLLGKLVPADTYVYLSIPNDPRRGEEYRQSRLHRLVTHPEIQAFIEPFRTSIRELVNKDGAVQKEIGIGLDELWEILGGPLAVAVFETGGKKTSVPNVVVSIGAEETDRLTAAAGKVRRKLGDRPGWQPQECKVAGHSIYSVGEELGGFHYAVLGRTVFASPSRLHLESILAKSAAGPAGSLWEAPNFVRLRKQLSPGDRSLASFYASLTPLWKRLEGMIPEEADPILTALGLKDLEAIGFSVEYDLPHLRERYAVLARRLDRGVLKLFAGSAAADPSLRYVPKDASAYGHVNLSLLEIYETALGIAMASPEGFARFDSALKDFEKRVGVNLRRDLLAKLGPSWTVYSRGGEMVAVTGLEDPKGFFEAVDKLMEQAELPMRREEHRGQPLLSLALSPRNAAAPPVPGLPFQFVGQSIVLLSKDSRLFIGLTTEPAAAFAERMTVHSESILDNPRYSELLAKVPKGAESLTLSDLGESAATLVGLLPDLLAGAGRLPTDPKTGKPLLDPSRLPKAETLRELVGVSVSFKRTEGSLIVMESLSTAGNMTTMGIAGGGIAAALLLPAIAKAVERARVTSCANNLSQLWKLQMVYMSQFGGRQKKMPAETGAAFWKALTKTEPPIIDETVSDILRCPFKDESTPGPAAYRGPRIEVSKLGPNDPVGCCEPGSHPNGTINVLLKSGDVIEVSPGDPLYQKAVAGTSR